MPEDKEGVKGAKSREHEPAKPSAFAHYLPITGWISSYEKEWLRRDVVAGLTVWGILVPAGIAYAEMAGAPAQVGLYTLLASLTLYAILGTSRQLIVAATSATAIMIPVTLAPLLASDGSNYTQMLAALVIMVGVIYLVAGLLRLGFLASFMSEPVMTGFVFGLAIYIIVHQLPKLFQVSKGSGDVFQQLWHLITNLGSANWYSFAIGAIGIVLLVLLERFLPRVPSALVCLALGIIIVTVLNLVTQQGVAVVGTVPSGLPKAVWPGVGYQDLISLLAGALGIVLVAFSETLGASQAFAEKHGYEIDVDQDLRAIGVANIGSGFLGGLVAGGSMSQSTVNDQGGAKSEASSLVAAAMVLVTVLFLMPLFKNVPKSILASIVITAVAHLMRVSKMRLYYGLNRTEFWLAMTALMGVIAIEILPGLLIAVALSLMLLVWKASRPPINEIGRVPGMPGEYGSMARHPENETVPGLIILRIEAPLFFANAGTVRDRLRSIIRGSPPPEAVIVDMQFSNELDISAADMLSKLMDEAQAAGVEVMFTEAIGPVRDMFRRTGLADKVGEENIYRTVDEGVRAFLEHAGEPAGD